MKKVSGPRFVILFLVLCAVVAAIFLYAMSGAYNSRPQLAIPDLSKKRYNPKIYDVRTKLAEAEPSKIDLAKVEATDIEVRCRGVFADLLKPSFSSDIEELVKVLAKDQCFMGFVFAEKGNLKKSNVIAQCEKDVTTPTCQQASIFFKVGLLNYLTKDTDLHELTEQQLVAKFLAQFDPRFTEGSDQSYFKTMKDIATEMLKRNSADPQYQDAFLQSEMLPNMQTDGKAKYTQEFDDLLNQKLHERPYDEKLQEYFFIRNIHLSLEEKIAQVDAVYAQNPDSAIAAYGLSALYLKKGDLVSTKKYLDRAVLLNPDSARFKETLRRFNAGERTNIHTVALSWGMQT